MSSTWVYFRLKRAGRRFYTRCRMFHEAPPNWLWKLKLYYFFLNRPREALRYFRLRKLVDVGKTEVAV